MTFAKMMARLKERQDTVEMNLETPHSLTPFYEAALEDLVISPWSQVSDFFLYSQSLGQHTPVSNEQPEE